MKASDYDTRWNGHRYQYNEYLPAQQPQRKDSSGSGSVSQSRTNSRPPPRAPEQPEQPTLRKMASQSGRKEAPLNNVEQSKIISALKSELSNLKFEVTKLISNDRDVSTAHSTVASYEPQYTLKQNGRTADQPIYDGRQSMTIQTHVSPQPQHYVSNHASTVQRKPSLQNELDARDTTFKQVDTLQMREDLRASQLRERKLAEERDDLARKLQERSKQLDSLKYANDNRSERLNNSKESTERSLNNIIQQLRKQNNEAQRYYVKRIQELENGCRQVEGRLSSKEHEVLILKQDINQLTARMKEEESTLSSNSSRYPKLIQQLQEANRTLTKDISELNDKIRQEQQRAQIAQQRISAAEMRAAASQQKASFAEHRANQRQNVQDQNKQFLESEKKKLLDEIMQLRDTNSKLIDETIKIREDRDQRIREKTREVEMLVADKERLVSSREDLMKQLERQRELAMNHQSSAANQLNNLVSNSNTLQIPSANNTSNLPNLGKSQLSKSSIIVLNSGNASLPQQSVTEQLKKQEIESLTNKIDHLKKQKRIVQQDIKALLETKQAIELSLKNMPQSKTVQQLRGQLTQKDQAVNNLCNDVKNLQAQLAKNARIEKKLKSNEALLREANEFIIRTQLAVLNKKYIA